MRKAEEESTMVDVNIRVPAFEKLLDYAASGIGAVAGPMLAPWRARKEAEARLLGTKTEAHSLKLIADAQADARRSLVAPEEAGPGMLEIGLDGIQQRIEFQEKKRQANIASVVRDAAAELGDKEVPDREPDPDWTARFFNDVQDVSSRELQQIWSKILAGEVESPGRTSIRTLSILKNMSRKDAEMFSTLSKYFIDDIIHDDSLSALIDDRLPLFGIKIAELGLVHGALDVYKTITLGSDGTKILLNRDNVLIVEGEPGKTIEMYGNVLTSPGKEIIQFCTNEADLEYFRNFAKFLNQHDCVLKFTPVVMIDSRGRAGYNQNDIRLIEPAP